MKRYLIRKFLDKDFDFFFGYFLGVILLTAIVIVAFGMTGAFASDVESYRGRFDHGYPVKVNDARYLSALKKDGLLIFTESEAGLTYDVTLSFGDKTEEINRFRHGNAVLNPPKKNLFPLRFREGDIYLSDLIANEFGCKRGDEITLGDRVYRYAGTFGGLYIDTRSSDLDGVFIVCTGDLIASSYTAVFFDMDDALSFSERVASPDDLGDDGGVLSYYKGMRLLRNAFVVFACFAALLAVLYYAVTISIYMMRKARSREILRAFGGSKGGYAFSVAASFSLVSILGTAFGLLMAALLRRIIDFWAVEIIGFSIGFGSFLLIFGGFAVASVLVIGVLTFVLSRRLDRDGTVFC